MLKGLWIVVKIRPRMYWQEPNHVTNIHGYQQAEDTDMRMEKREDWANRLTDGFGQIRSEVYKENRETLDPPTKTIFGEEPSLSTRAFLDAMNSYYLQDRMNGHDFFDRLADGEESLTIDDYQARRSDYDPPADELFGEAEELDRRGFSEALDDYDKNN